MKTGRANGQPWTSAKKEENTRENFGYVFDRKLEELVLNRMDRNSAQGVKFLDNPELRAFITRLLRDQVYDRVQSEAMARANGK